MLTTKAKTSVSSAILPMICRALAGSGEARAGRPLQRRYGRDDAPGQKFTVADVWLGLPRR